MELATIQTSRLDLRPLPLPAYHLLATGRQSEAERLLGIKLDGSRLVELSPIIRRRVDQLQRDPSELPWLIHLVILREQPAMIGDIGFHSPRTLAGSSR
jgi:hypothetical protein